MISRRRNRHFDLLDSLLGGRSLFEDFGLDDGWFYRTTELLGSPIGLENYEAENGVAGVKATFEVPGYDSEGLELNYDRGMLTVMDKPEKKGGKHKICLRARLPKNIDSETISAICEHGLLTVTAQYREARKPEKQLIKIS